MRKVILDLAVTLDGFIEGPNGEIDWCIMDGDMDFPGFLAGIDTIFYGRVSYEKWGNFLPGPDADEEEKNLWSLLHAKKKYVFTRSPQQHFDDPVITSDISTVVEEIKKEKGKDIWLYGGSGLITTFIQKRMIDRYQISVHPTVLGEGKPLFENMKKRLDLNLVHVNTFRSGVVQLVYESGARQID